MSVKIQFVSVAQFRDLKSMEIDGVHTAFFSHEDAEKVQAALKIDGDLALADRTIASQRESINAHVQEVRDLQNEIARGNKTIDRLKEQIKDLCERAAECPHAEQIERLEDSLAARDAQNGTLNGIILARDNEIAQIRSHVAHRDAQDKTIRQVKEECKDAVLARDREIASLNDQIARLQSDMSTRDRDLTQQHRDRTSRSAYLIRQLDEELKKIAEGR